MIKSSPGRHIDIESRRLRRRCLRSTCPTQISAHTIILSSPHDSFVCMPHRTPSTELPTTLATVCHSSTIDPLRLHQSHPPVLVQALTLISSHTHCIDLNPLRSHARVLQLGWPSAAANPQSCSQPLQLCNSCTRTHLHAHSSPCVHIISPSEPPSFRSSQPQKAALCIQSTAYRSSGSHKYSYLECSPES